MTLFLSRKRCVACEGGVPPLTQEEIAKYQPEVPEWHVAADNLSISRSFTFRNFKEALAFLNNVGGIAEEEGHHPGMGIHDFKHVYIQLTTHAIKGLSENDFILAAKIDSIR
jgi:4a-hydroxytetrahydrobiopterin dehydratase